VTGALPGSRPVDGLPSGGSPQRRAMPSPIADASASFIAAKPVWLAGKKNEMNVTGAFRAVVQAPTRPGATLAIAAATVYRAFVNGEFLGHGPARGPHGHFRIDRWDLDAHLRPGENVIAIEVAGYNSNSYYVLDQPSFVQAEVVIDGAVAAATAAHGGFHGRQLRERMQKVPRFSLQRPFSEVWRVRPEWDGWRATPGAAFKYEELAEQPGRWLIPRRVPHARFAVRQPTHLSASGTLQTGVAIDRLWRPWYHEREGLAKNTGVAGYLEAEREIDQSFEWQRAVMMRSGGSPKPYQPAEPLPLEERTWRMFDLGTNLTGFLGVRLVVKRQAKIDLVFDEILTNGLVDFRRGQTINIVQWQLQPGEYRLETFEPYTARWLTIACLEGEAEIRGAWLREYANDSVWEAQFACDDEQLNEVFAAGRETFRQNAVDIFMDCPGRERAGWLCDSFFTARVAFDLCGTSAIERSFIENFLLPERFEHLPEGMLPMCYPADHRDSCFIPNWALWFVVQLPEYLARSGDRAMIDALRPRVMALFAYFDRLVNSDGLLEKLESWVFLEWSKANEFTQDVNYPSNMLFAGALAAAGRLYADQALLDRAERVRTTVRTQSFDGTWFVDNAVRKDGKLERTANRSEVCQYYAFFFDVATQQEHAALWSTLVKDFGPDRAERKLHAEIHPANAFIGTYLRLELLSRHGRSQQLMDESIGFFHKMATRTGTLWEHLGTEASCNHGFASHVCHALYRDALGVRSHDAVQKKLRLRFADLKLPWCQGRMPTPDGAITLSWRREGGALRYRLAAPLGWTVEIENASGKELVFEGAREESKAAR
jgi:alpha-L-rhamnosidase